MIKVRILQGFTAAGAAAVAIPSLVGCTQPADDQAIGTGSENNTESVAGSGEIVLHGWALDYRSTSGGDEFVRVTEKMKTSVAFEEVLNLVAYADPALQQALRAAPAKLEVKPKLVYTKFDESKTEVNLAALAWKPGSSNILYGTSEEFTIPTGVKRLSIELSATFEKNGAPKTVDVLKGQGIRNEFVVFGGFLPNKLVLFDTAGADRRTRVVEGGKLVPGAHVSINVTDWRLDTIVDKSSLDLRVGQQMSGSRFGPVIVDALGALEYEVGAVVSFDDGATYQPVGLSKVMKPDVFARSDGWRYAFAAELAVPDGARGNAKFAFHVRAFLQVPNGTIMNARYAPGQRVLLKDVWDNNAGKDYALPLGRD